MPISTMRLIAATMILSSLGILFGSHQNATAGKKDSETLQGTWVGKKGPINIKMTFKGDNFTLNMSDDKKGIKVMGKFTVDASKSPKTMDMKVNKGEGKGTEKFIGKTALGIYKFEDGGLTWCATTPGGKKRPKEFSPQGALLLSLKRQK